MILVEPMLKPGRLFLAASLLGRRAILGMFGQSRIPSRDLLHFALGGRVRHVFGRKARLLGAIPPILRIADLGCHGSPELPAASSVNAAVAVRFRVANLGHASK